MCRTRSQARPGTSGSAGGISMTSGRAGFFLKISAAEQAADRGEDGAENSTRPSATRPSRRSGTRGSAGRGGCTRSSMSRISGGIDPAMSMTRCAIARSNGADDQVDRNRDDDRDERADEAGEQPDQRAVARRRSASTDSAGTRYAATTPPLIDPQAAAGVADVDERQRRQHAHHQAADRAPAACSWA